MLWVFCSNAKSKDDSSFQNVIRFVCHLLYRYSQLQKLRNEKVNTECNQLQNQSNIGIDAANKQTGPDVKPVGCRE